MGTHYRFECTRCAYAVEVSGGFDRGMSGYVHTALCHTCRPARLVDASKTGDPFEEAYRDATDFVCPHGRTRTHVLALWSHPGACPRCGAPMHRDEANITLWD